MPELEDLPLVTTVAGSYPVDGLPPRRAIQRAVEDQLVAGIDVISDGQARGDMISVFARAIPGLRQADDGVWEVESALDLPDAPILAADFALARELAAGRAEVKGIVTGPVTLALACRVTRESPYLGPEDPALILRLSEILEREVAALVASGAVVVQIDEPTLAVALETRVSSELAYDALRSLAAIPHLPMLHVCGDVRAIAMELLALPFAVLSFENTRVDNLDAFDPDALAYVGGRLCAGCVDTQTNTVESVATIRARIQAAIARVDATRLWLAPDCGQRLLSYAAARAKLINLGAAAQAARADL